MTGEETPGTTYPLAISNAAVSLFSRIGARIERDESEGERGAALVEYGLLLLLVFLVAIVSLQVFGETIIGVFQSTGDTLDNA